MTHGQGTDVGVFVTTGLPPGHPVGDWVLPLWHLVSSSVAPGGRGPRHTTSPPPPPRRRGETRSHRGHPFLPHRPSFVTRAGPHKRLWGGDPPSRGSRRIRRGRGVGVGRVRTDSLRVSEEAPDRSSRLFVPTPHPHTSSVQTRDRGDSGTDSRAPPHCPSPQSGNRPKSFRLL